MDALDPGRPGEKAVEPARGQHVGARDRAAERHHFRPSGIFEKLNHAGGDRDLSGFPVRPRGLRRLPHRRGAMGDVKAGFRPRLENAAILEQAVGLEHGRDADGVLEGDAPHRGRTHTGAQRASFDQARNDARQFLIAIGFIAGVHTGQGHGASLLSVPI